MVDKAAGAPVTQAVTALFDGFTVRDAVHNLREALREVDAVSQESTGMNTILNHLVTFLESDATTEMMHDLDVKLQQCYYRGQYVLTPDSDDEARLNLGLTPRK